MGKGRWPLMTDDDNQNVHELLKATGSITGNEKIVPGDEPERNWNPARDLNKNSCKIACDAAYSAAVVAASSLSSVSASAAAIVVATAETDKCRGSCENFFNDGVTIDKKM